MVGSFHKLTESENDGEEKIQCHTLYFRLSLSLFGQSFSGNFPLALRPDDAFPADQTRTR
jgi:hypothetical protein